MKAKSFLFSMLAAATLVGCSSDDVMEEVGGHGLDDGKAYMKVRIALPGEGSSRATDGGFVNGSISEQAIKDIQFVFYDANGKFYGMGTRAGAQAYPQGGVGTTGQNVEAIANSVIALETNNVTNYPARLVAFVNVGAVDLNNKSLEQAMTLTATDKEMTLIATDKEGKNVEYFVMTSSSYWDGKQTKCWADVTSSDFYPTQDAALSASNTVNVHVERLASKVTIKQGDGLKNNMPSVSVGDKKLTFHIDGFALNATNKESYYLKNVEDYTDYLDFDWNNAVNYRCYWATDPNYTINGPLPEPTPESPAKFEYKNWNAVDEMMAEGTSVTEYCLENTFGGMPNNKFYFDQATHALVVGHYTIDNPAPDAKPESFYIYSGVLYIEKDFKNHMMNTVKDILFVQETLPDGTISYKNLSADYFQVVKASSSEATIELNVDKLKDPVTQIVKDLYKDTEGNKYKDIAEANTAIKTMVGTAEAYTDGKAYFAVKIEHLGTLGTDKINAGDYGVVRNHHYELSINSIKGLGTGVYNPGEVIIPNPTTKKYYVGATLNILSWKKVNQNVDL